MRTNFHERFTTYYEIKKFATRTRGVVGVIKSKEQKEAKIIKKMTVGSMLGTNLYNV